ncbi:MAG: lysophospholipid acyltransferase family protein [Longimicrobiales bacterium]|nr:lysophospholipid acyltransferase family protein [Longimicrobiales bacterium]
MLRLLLVLVVIIPATVWYGARMIWAAMRNSPSLGCVCDSSPRRWSRLLLKCSGVDVVFENPEAIDPDKPQILVANHVSWFDVLALAAHLPGRYLFVAKRELEKVPVFGRAVRVCGHIFIDRQDRNRAVESLATARERLEAENPTVIMFPEGTRSATGTLQPFKKGAFVLAIQTGVDVIPAAIEGSREVMKKGSLLIRPGTIRVRFGEPIDVGALGMEDRTELTTRAQVAVAGLQSAGAS